jgi:hypothetical protein
MLSSLKFWAGPDMLSSCIMGRPASKGPEHWALNYTPPHFRSTLLQAWLVFGLGEFSDHNKRKLEL